MGSLNTMGYLNTLGYLGHLVSRCRKTPTLSECEHHVEVDPILIQWSNWGSAEIPAVPKSAPVPKTIDPYLITFTHISTLELRWDPQQSSPVWAISGSRVVIAYLNTCGTSNPHSYRLTLLLISSSRVEPFDSWSA